MTIKLFGRLSTLLQPESRDSNLFSTLPLASHTTSLRNFYISQVYHPEKDQNLRNPKAFSAFFCELTNDKNVVLSLGEKSAKPKVHLQGQQLG